MLGIALEGGGICGIAEIGALEDLEERGCLERTTHFTGSSAGSIIALMLACRISVKEKLKDIMLKMDFSVLSQAPGHFSYLSEAYNLYKNYGLHDSVNIRIMLEKVLEKDLGLPKTLTFREVHEKFGSFLIIPCCVIGKMSPIYYNPKNKPDMQVCEAIQQSCNIPLYFGAIPAKELHLGKEKEHLVVDGGMIDNLPLRALYQYVPAEKCLGIKLYSSVEGDQYNPTSKECVPSSLEEYIKVLVDMLRAQSMRVYIHKEDFTRCIKIDIQDVSVTDFSLSDEKKQFLLKQGKEAANAFFNQSSDSELSDHELSLKQERAFDEMKIRHGGTWPFQPPDDN